MMQRACARTYSYAANTNVCPDFRRLRTASDGKLGGNEATTSLSMAKVPPYPLNIILTVPFFDNRTPALLNMDWPF